MSNLTTWSTSTAAATLETAPSATVTSPAIITQTVAALPRAVVIILAVVALGLGALLMVAGHRSFSWGKYARDPPGSKNHPRWLAGGVGGLVSGTLALPTVSTLVLLAALSPQLAPSVSPVAVVVMWVLTAGVGGASGGHWRPVGPATLALLAALALTLLVTLSLHLSTLIPRLIILAILVPTLLGLSLFPRTAASLAVFSALVGGYLLVIGIDLLCPASMSDALGLLVSPGGVGAQPPELAPLSSLGKGLLALWWLSTIASVAWQLHWGVDHQQETWDAYLGHLVASPTFNTSSRLGQFFPRPSFLGRLFSPRATYPPPTLTEISSSRRHRRRHQRHNSEDYSPSADHGDAVDDWDSDAETLHSKSAAPAKYSRALAHDDDDNTQSQQRFDYAEYAAYDLGLARRDSPDPGDSDEERVEHRSPPDRGPRAGIKERHRESIPLSALARPSSSRHPEQAESPGPHLVPATPSLIQALLRVNEAQQQARGHALPASRVEPQVTGPLDDWWKQVEATAREGE